MCGSLAVYDFSEKIIEDKEGIMDYGFVGQLADDEIISVQRLEMDDFMCISKDKYWESTGFKDTISEDFYNWVQEHVTRDIIKNCREL